MSYQDWERFGEDIRRTVQDAVDSRDFNRLNQTISNTINGAMDSLGRSFQNVGDAVDRTAQNMKEQARSQAQQKGRRGQAWDKYRYYGKQDGQAYGRDIKKPEPGQAQTAVAERKYSELFKKTAGVQAEGIFLAAAGGVVTLIMLLMGIFTLIGAAVTGEFGAGGAILTGMLAIFTLGGIILGSRGTALLGRIKRFKAYIRQMEGKEYCEIKELAESSKKSVKYAVKDIERMIQKGWFKQGHLDRQKTCLIVSNDAYIQYTDLMMRMEEQKKEEELARERRASKKQALDPQVQEVIQAGDEYVRKIRECNDAILGEEISAKISRIEMLVDRIFDRVEQNPDCIPDVRRLMEYYLPTTVKLLEAYEELDAQPVQGENILSSKGEIENTLDTLNIAFEKLLDSLFQDAAWDVSADISVLNTMLAQEGLTRDDF